MPRADCPHQCSRNSNFLLSNSNTQHYGISELSRFSTLRYRRYAYAQVLHALMHALTVGAARTTLISALICPYLAFMAHLGLCVQSIVVSLLKLWSFVAQPVGPHVLFQPQTNNGLRPHMTAFEVLALESGCKHRVLRDD